MTARHAFSVAEGQISIFPTDADGNAITTDPIYLGAVFENLTIHEGLEEIMDRPSGVVYPEAHHGAEEHTFDFEKLWEVELPLVDPPADLIPVILPSPGEQPITNGKDYKLRPNTYYVVVFKWQDERDPTRFHYRIYHGVTDRSHDVSGSESDNGHRSRFSFRAQYYL